MTRRYRGCYRGPCYTKVSLLGGRLVLSVCRYRRETYDCQGTRRETSVDRQAAAGLRGSAIIYR